MWHEATHTIKKNGKTYTYPAIRAAVRIDKKHINFSRVYGGKRNRKEAIKLVEDWYNNQPKYVKLADRK